nr:hypothetical protein [uncultured Flavobacterium sp.]
MKKSVINILALASVITTVGFLLDSDPIQPNVLMRFVEYVAMLTIVFALLFGFYSGIKAIIKRIQIIK